MAIDGEEDLALRCSQWTRRNHVDPVGTAGSYRSFLLVEWPLPWPRDATEITELAETAARANAVGARLQLLLGPSDRVDHDRRTVIAYHWDHELGRYSGVESLVPASAVAETANAMLRSRSREQHPEPPRDARPIEAVDLLVCGHGRRDRCCGSLGTSLEMELASGQALSSRGRPVRVWRTSHTGGHRFAPTALLFPEGTCWGYLDGDTIRSVLERSRPFADVRGHYRGCCGLESPGGQALEREVLSMVGWDVLDRARHVSPGTDGHLRVVLDGERPETYEAAVTVSRTLPVPACGQPIGEATKTEDELVVGTVRIRTPA